MTSPKSVMPRPRIRPMENGSPAQVEFGIDYTDGYHVTVEWAEEDDIWYARLDGAQAEENVLGHGETKEEALLCLCCSLACLSDALYHELYPPRNPERFTQ